MAAIRKPYHRPRRRGAAARSRDPAAAARRRELARAYAEAGQLEAAVRALRSAVVLDASSTELRLELVRTLYRSGDLEGAWAWLAGVTGGAAAEKLRAQLAVDLKRPKQAARAAERALALAPGDESLRLELAASMLGAGLVTAAERLLDYEFSEARRGQAGRLRLLAAHQAGRPQQVLDQLHSLPAAARDAELWLLGLEAARQLGSSNREQLALVEVALESHPENAHLQLARARLLAEGPERNTAALEQARQLLSTLAESAPTTTLQAEALFLLAELEARRADGGEKAQQLYRQGLQLAPGHVPGQVGLGRLLVEAGRSAEAVPWLVQAVVTQPENLEAIHWLGLALGTLADDEAVARWFGLLLATLPNQAPELLAQLLRSAQEAGRREAHQEVTREAHRVKNLLAVAAAELAPGDPTRDKLQELYRAWAEFLNHLREPGHRASHPVASLLRLALADAGADEHRVQLVMAPGLPPLWGDGAQLAAALANIVRNALQASAPGLPVRVAARSPAPGWVEIAVSDRGPGIALERQRLIFEPGYTTRPGGSGLGLSIARQVIQRHGGRIAVLSAPGGPTTFTVRLPAARPALAPTCGRPRPAAEPAVNHG